MHLNPTQKYWLFLITVSLATLYLFEPTSRWEWVSTLFSLKLEPAPIISIKNLITAILAYMLYKIYDAGR